jgi:hypothetical protein
MISEFKQSDDHFMDDESMVMVKACINDDKLKSLHDFVSVISKKFRLEKTSADLLITINKQTSSIMFQFGKSRDNSKFLLQISHIEIDVLENMIDLPLNLFDFSTKLSTFVSDNLTISFNIDGCIILEMESIKEITSYCKVIFQNKELQVYHSSCVGELRFPTFIHKWKFEMKDKEVRSFKKFLKLDKNNKEGYKFTITKLDMNMIQLHLIIENNESEFKKDLSIVNISDNYFQNNVPISYNTSEIQKIFPLMRNNVKSLIFSFDSDLEMLIEQVDGYIKVCGSFSSIIYNDY